MDPSVAHVVDAMFQIIQERAYKARHAGSEEWDGDD